MRASLLGRVRAWARLEPHLSDVLGGASVSFFLRVVSRGLSLGFNILLARQLGAEGAGVYYLALTVTTLGGVVGRLGVPNALLRFSAAHAAGGDWEGVAGLYRQGMRVAALGSLLVTGLLLLGAGWIAREIFSEAALGTPLRLMSLVILPASLLVLHSHLLRGLGKIRDSLLAEAVGVPLISLVLLAGLGRAWGVRGAVGAYVIATGVSLVWGVLLWRRAAPKPREARGAFDRGLLLRTSLPMFSIAVMSVVIGWADIFLLGVWEPSQQVGIYGVAVRLSVLISFVLTAVNTASAPKFAVLYARDEKEELGRLARGTALLMALLALPLLLLFLAAPGWVLGWFGPEFQAGAVALMILAVGQFANVATGSVGYLLLMSGHEKAYQTAMVVATGLNLLLNVLLIPRYGMEGAAVATAASRVLGNLLAATAVYRKLSILTLPLPRLRSS